MTKLTPSFLKHKLTPKWLLVGSIFLTLFFILNQCTFSNKAKINFNTQVKPIFNKKCIHCHGGVKQNGGFSLMTREKALAVTSSGKSVIIPGDPNGSEFIRRLKTQDVEERMPFESEALPQAEIEVLTQWVKEGAEWGVHWAYTPVQAVTIPNSEVSLGTLSEPNNDPWAINDIDYFILKKLAEKDLSPSKIAEKSAMLRRVSLDLIGLPAPKNLAAQFLKNDQSITYEQVVDSLLASPHFGERWATMWLDLARYADSKGFERDYARSIWQYRDYLIRAFNADLPYDQFLTEQLAGDLLPNPTDDQYIATGFHRNTTTNDEGGTDNEEYRVAAVIDRVNTTGEAILGTTFSCMQCHGHPYDPFEHQEYYQLMSFFNNTRDEDTAKDYPWLRLFEKEDSAKLEDLTNWVAKVDSEKRADDMNLFLKTWQPTIYSIDTDSFINADLYDTKYLGFRKDGQARMKNITLTGKNKLILNAQTFTSGGHFTIHLDNANGNIVANQILQNTKGKGHFFEIPLTPTTGKYDLYLRYENPSLVNKDQRGLQIDWFYFTEDFPAQNDAEYTVYQQYFWDLMEAQPPYTLITLDNPAERQRTTKIFDRGNWLTQREVVQSAVPKILNPFPENAPKNRLGLAQWITDKQNPLTARTMVNRLWEQLFGQGLVETVEDLGTQGTSPTHPELLEHLAYKFMNDYEWSVKKLLKEMVMSATYRQSNKLSPQLLEADFYNQLYTRGPRVRLSAEQIRDQALTVSGLLNSKMYGKPVMPYQPDGVWQTPYNDDEWILSPEKEPYRRAVYTYMKRSAPYPSMSTFDVNDRQVCSSRRIRTNTPLQALVTLNDPVYVEAASYFAIRMQELGGSDIKDQIKSGYQLALGKTIEPAQLSILENLYMEALANYENNQKEVLKMVKHLPIKAQFTETAALTVVANALMNLDEFMMK